MINKYAEIQDRILLYNACKGILRVKMAAPSPSVLGRIAGFGNTIGTHIGNGKNKFFSWLTNPETQKKIQGLNTLGSLVQTGASATGSVMGAMNQSNAMAAANAQAEIEDRKAKLEQARLDMIEHQLNQKRKAMGLGRVGTGVPEEQAEQQYELDAQGNPVLDANGKPVLKKQPANVQAAGNPQMQQPMQQQLQQ